MKKIYLREELQEVREYHIEVIESIRETISVLRGKLLSL